MLYLKYEVLYLEVTSMVMAVEEYLRENVDYQNKISKGKNYF